MGMKRRKLNTLNAKFVAMRTNLIIIFSLCIFLPVVAFGQKASSEPEEGPSAMEAIFDQKYGVLIDSILEENVSISSRQLNALLEEYFEMEVSKGGEVIYKPKMITFQYETPVLTETNAGVDTKIEMMPGNIKIPAVSLANINFLKVQEVEVEEGEIEIKLGETNMMPNGLQRLIDLLSQSARPY